MLSTCAAEAELAAVVGMYITVCLISTSLDDVPRPNVGLSRTLPPRLHDYDTEDRDAAGYGNVTCNKGDSAELSLSAIE